MEGVHIPESYKVRLVGMAGTIGLEIPTNPNPKTINERIDHLLVECEFIVKLQGIGLSIAEAESIWHEVLILAKSLPVSLEQVSDAVLLLVRQNRFKNEPVRSEELKVMAYSSIDKYDFTYEYELSDHTDSKRGISYRRKLHQINKPRPFNRINRSAGYNPFACLKS